jgi:hypothetical protein
MQYGKRRRRTKALAGVLKDMKRVAAALDLPKTENGLDAAITGVMFDLADMEHEHMLKHPKVFKKA